jgi:serine/threonine-protein kinase
MLPFGADAGSKALSDGLLQDTADRLKRVKPSGRTIPAWLDSHSRAKLTIIPIGDAVQNHVDGPEKAARMLGATHTLTGQVSRDDSRISIHARLTDTRSSLPLKEWQAEYATNELRNVPVALAGMVTGTLRLPPLVIAATVNTAAYADFAAGVGLLRRNTGIDAAIPLLKRAVVADPDSPLTYARLAEAEALKYRLTNDASWLERAKNSLQEAERRNPDLAMVRLVSAIINQYEGSYDKAESDLRRSLDIEPLNGDLWRRLGKVYHDNNHFTEALAAFQKAIEVQPDYFKNYQDLCSLDSEQANYVEAVRQCWQVAQLAPDLSDAHLALAIAYYNLEEYTKCESELDIALRLDPASSKALQSRAVELFYRNRLDEAIPWFRRAIEAGPATITLYLDSGISLELTGHTSEAREKYRQGVALADKELEKNPADGFVKSALALLCARLGQRDRAESEAGQARRFAAGSVEIAKLLVRTYEVLGRRTDALELIQNMPGDALKLLNTSPDLAGLRGDPRFHQLMLSRHIQ